MFTLFFIRRPIVACVLSILLVIAGAVSYITLPIAQYPDLAPPVVNVSATYPGASAQVVADAVAAPIEQQVNGVDNMLYFESKSASDGSYTLDVTFKVGTDPDLSSVLVQNRISAAMATLPAEVQQQGVTTKKKSTSIVGVISLAPQDEQAARTYNDLFLANYMSINLIDQVKRTVGVGDTSLFPAKDYAMRVWFDPEKLTNRGLTVVDVINALKEQNVQVAAGLIGQAPAPQGQAFQYTINTLGRLETPEEFEQIILKSENGRLVRMRDVARLELGAKNYDTLGRAEGLPGAVLIVYQAPGGNSVETAEALQELVKEFSAGLPDGIACKITYDTSEFVLSAVEEVQHTLIEAIVLVLIVVLIFLGSIRSSLIPILAIPVSLIGTFLFMKIFGFSINLPTLFGLVLAIGIVVDDAIIVVENVERVLVESHLPPRQATAKAMIEVFGAIVGVSLVLMAVFGPTAALPGISGELYRQFALTIAVSTFLSAICALTLSPALAGLLLKAHDKNHKPNFFKRGFDKAFDLFSGAYASMIRVLIHPASILFSLGAFAACCFAIVWSVGRVPMGFVPVEDKGILFVELWLPDSSSQERVLETMKKAEAIVDQVDGIEVVTGLGGYSLINGAGSNYAAMFCTLESWSVRVPKGRDIQAITQDMRKGLAALDECISLVYGMPPVDGLGTGSGFEMRVQDRGARGREVLGEAVMELAAKAATDPSVTAVNSGFRLGVPQLFADVDREKVKKLNVPLQDVFTTLGASLGARYVNDFNLYDRTWKVYVQAEDAFRNDLGDIAKLRVRNMEGNMLPLGSVVDVRPDFGPNQVMRFNMYTSAALSGEPTPGKSSGEAIAAMESLARQTLPDGVGFAWTSMAFQEKLASGQAGIVFILALIVVYLILAALYENWFTPLSVILSIPLAVLGAMLGLMWRGMDNNIYTQVGLVLLVGLGAKNAILIVEFARANRIAGKSITDSVVEASRQRLRPILMTAFAFILGVLPLVLASGAGAASRQAIGTAVFFGMIGNTFLGLIFTPILWVAIQWVNERISGAPKPEEPLFPEGDAAAPGSAHGHAAA
jgi:HAE1 family hydrophobic/amphiphilic exporter-1